MRTRLAVAAAAGLVVIAAGVAWLVARPSASQAPALTPADALAYASVRTSGGQVAALEDLLGRLPVEISDDGVVATVGGLLDDPLGEVGLTFDDDIAPWLGDEIGGFVLAPPDPQDPPDGAVLAATTDADASRAAARKILDAEGREARERTHREVTYTASTDGTFAYTVLDGFLVAGVEQAVRAAVDASHDGGLDTSERFTAARGRLGDDRLVSYHVDVSALFEAMEAAGELTRSELEDMAMFGLDEGAVTAGAISVGDDRITVGQASRLTEGDRSKELLEAVGSSRLAGSVPADSWLAFEVPAIGARLDAILQTVEGSGPPEMAELVEEGFREELGLDLRDDVLAWMGNLRLFVRGEAPLAAEGALVVDSDDEEATRRFVERVVELAEEDGAPTRPVERDGLEGASVQEAGMPAPVFILGGPRLILGYGQDATDEAIVPTEPLEQDPTYRAAAEALDGYAAGLFVDLEVALGFAENAMGLAGAPTETYETQVRPWLEPFSYLVAGTRRDGDTLLQRVVVGLREATDG